MKNADLPLHSLCESADFLADRQKRLTSSLSLFAEESARYVAGQLTGDDLYAALTRFLTVSPLPAPLLAGVGGGAFAKSLADRLTAADQKREYIGELIGAFAYSGARIACVHAPNADEGYRQFARILPSPTVHYVSSYKEACQAVDGGDADFCILPVANSEGTLTTFLGFADEYRLCQCDECRVFHADGTDASRFGLFARRPLFQKRGGIWSLAVTLPLTLPLPDLLAGLHFLGNEVRSLVSFTEEGSVHCRLALSLPCASLFPTLLYLTQFAPARQMNGIFKEFL